jgi:hypothetical protein
VHGLGALQSPQDLLAKIQRDLKRMEVNPLDSDAAFDFFVTAYHMHEWISHAYPGQSKSEYWKDVVRREPLLGITGNVGNGAKHFVAEKWKQVSSVRRLTGMFGDSFGNSFGNSFGPRRLQIQLAPAEAQRMGRTSVGALEIAKAITDFWTKELARIVAATPAPSI